MLNRASTESYSTREEHYRNSINFWHGLIFVNFGHTKNTEIYSAHAHAITQKIPKFIPHMRMQSHKKLYCTGQNDEIKSRRKLKILEKFGNVLKLKPPKISTITVF